MTNQEAIKHLKNMKWLKGYDNTTVGEVPLGNIIDQIIALLEEREEVEPIKPIDVDDSFTFLCSNCKGELFCGDRIRDKYCSTCGRKLKWNDS